jgi:hypothetical protein
VKAYWGMEVMKYKKKKVGGDFVPIKHHELNSENT